MSEPGDPGAIDLSFLQGIPLFGGLEPQPLARIASHLVRRSVAEGTTVVTEGDSAREMFIVESGEVEVLIHRDTKSDPDSLEEIVLAVLLRGDYFGEMSLLDVQPRSATVRARTEVSLLALPYHELLMLQRADSQAFTLLVMNLAREISRRMRVFHGHLVELLLERPDRHRLTQQIFGSPRPR